MVIMGLFGPPNVHKLKLKGEINGLIKCLNNKEPWNIRRDAAEALGDIRAQEAVVPLIAALNDTDSFVQRNAAEALGKIGDPRAVDSLIITLNDRTTDVRKESVKALKKIGNPAVESLIAAMLQNKPLLVRMAATEILGEIGDIRSVNPLITSLEDNFDQVSFRAGEALILAYKNPKSPMHNKVVESIDNINIKSIEPLIYALVFQRSMGSIWTYELLKKIGNNATKPLISIMENPNRMMTLRKIPGSNSEIEGLQLLAIEGLVIIGDAQAVDPLIAQLKNKDSDVRKEAAKALGEIGDPRAVDPLIVLINDYKDYSCNKGIEALGKIGDPKAVDPLIAQLKNKDSDVRKEAVKALGKIGDLKAVDPLISALNGTDNGVICEALGDIGDEKAMDSLLKISDIHKKEDWISGDDYEWLAYESWQRIGSAAREAILKIQEKHTKEAHENSI